MTFDIYTISFDLYLLRLFQLKDIFRISNYMPVQIVSWYLTQKFEVGEYIVLELCIM